jgi:flagellar hook-associated protein 3 FlgL
MANGIVGDAFRHKQTVAGLVKQRAAVHDGRSKEISGKVDLEKLGAKVVLLNSLKKEAFLCDAFIQHNEFSVKIKLDGTKQAVRDILEEARKFKQTLITFNDGIDKDPTAFLDDFKRYMQTIEQKGNTRIGDSYILGGTITNLPPFMLSEIPDGIDPLSAANTDYYKGNNQVMMADIDTDRSLEFNIKGDHSAFEKLIRALKIATDPSIKSGDDRIIKAQELLDEAMQELTGLMARIDSEIEGLDQLIESQTSRLSYTNDKLEELMNANELETVTDFMKDQQILDTAYAMTGQIANMSLAGYLRG